MFWDYRLGYTRWATCWLYFFCVDNAIPIWTVRCFPSNKLLITSDLKELLSKKKRPFKDGDRELLRSVQKELKFKITRQQGGVQEKAGEQASTEQRTACVLRDEEDHRLQAEGGSNRWKAGQSKWTELILQQVQFRNKLSILLSCLQPNRPPTLPWPTTSLSYLETNSPNLLKGTCHNSYYRHGRINIVIICRWLKLLSIWK